MGAFSARQSNATRELFKEDYGHPIHRGQQPDLLDELAAVLVNFPVQMGGIF